MKCVRSLVDSSAWSAMRVISSVSWSTSIWIDARSSSQEVSFADAIESTRIRWRMFISSLSRASAAQVLSSAFEADCRPASIPLCRPE